MRISLLFNSSVSGVVCNLVNGAYLAHRFRCAVVVVDFEKRWEDNAFYANLRNYYHSYVIKKKIEGIWWDHMYYKVFLRVQSLVKERLKMESENFEHRHFAGVR